MKKLLSILFASLLICSACIRPVAASTPSIFIDGGEVAGGGIASGTNAKGDIAALLASLVLASQGVSVGLKSDSSILPIDFVKSLLEEYANLIGTTFESLCNQWISNVEILADGCLSMGMENCKTAYKFLSWLKNDGYISGNLGDRDYVLIGGVLCPVVYPQDIIDTFYDSNGQYAEKNAGSDKFVIFWSYYQGRKHLYYVFYSSFVKTLNYFRGSPISSYINTYYGTNLNGLYYYYRSTNSDVQFNVPFVENPIESITALNGSLNNAPVDPDEDSLIGDDSNVNPDDFNISDNEVNIINPGLDLNALAIQSGIDGILQIKEYIDALIRSVNGIEDNVLKVNDGITGILEEIPIDLNVFESTTVEDEEDSDSGMSIIDSNSYPDQESTQKYLQHMQFNLINIFPFCIPFDIFNLLSKLDVEPVTPNVHLSFPNPVLDDPIEFDLNFSQWNGVASTVRHMELFAFVIGLALVTRNIIRG